MSHQKVYTPKNRCWSLQISTGVCIYFKFRICTGTYVQLFLMSHLSLLFQSTGYIMCIFASLAPDIILRTSIIIGSKVIADVSVPKKRSNWEKIRNTGAPSFMHICYILAVVPAFCLWTGAYPVQNRWAWWLVLSEEWQASFLLMFIFGRVWRITDLLQQNDSTLKKSSARWSVIN